MTKIVKYTLLFMLLTACEREPEVIFREVPGTRGCGATVAGFPILDYPYIYYTWGFNVVDDVSHDYSIRATLLYVYGGDTVLVGDNLDHIGVASQFDYTNHHGFWDWELPDNPNDYLFIYGFDVLCE